MKSLYKTVNTNGEYSCGDIGISAEEWFQLLKHPEAMPYHDTSSALRSAKRQHPMPTFATRCKPWRPHSLNR